MVILLNTMNGRENMLSFCNTSQSVFLEVRFARPLMSTNCDICKQTKYACQSSFPELVHGPRGHKADDSKK